MSNNNRMKTQAFIEINLSDYFNNQSMVLFPFANPRFVTEHRWSTPGLPRSI